MRALEIVPQGISTRKIGMYEVDECRVHLFVTPLYSLAALLTVRPSNSVLSYGLRNQSTHREVHHGTYL